VHTRVYFPEEIRNSIPRITDLVVNFFSKGSSSIQRLDSLKGTLIEPIDGQVFDLLSAHIFGCESMSPFAGDIFVKMLSEHLNIGNCQIFTQEFLEKIAFQNMEESSANLFLDSVSLAGLKGKIVVKPSLADSAFVELTSGYTFEGLTPSFHVNEKEFKDPRIICIDGYIENVSEIHRLLESTSTSKEVVVLFVRGLSHEVVHTLKVNYDRKTVLLIPVTVPFDIDGINLLNDIAVIAECDVVSSNKGQLISSLELSDTARIEKVNFLSGNTLLHNGNSQNRIDRHIKILQSRLQNSHDLSKDTFEKRIQRLGTSQVNVMLPDNQEFLDLRFKFDRCIRSIKKSIEFGVVEVNGKIYPYSSYQAALLFKNKFHSSTNDIGCIVE